MTGGELVSRIVWLREIVADGRSYQDGSLPSATVDLVSAVLSDLEADLQVELDCLWWLGTAA